MSTWQEDTVPPTFKRKHPIFDAKLGLLWTSTPILIHVQPDTYSPQVFLLLPYPPSPQLLYFYIPTPNGVLLCSRCPNHLNLPMNSSMDSNLLGTVEVEIIDRRFPRLRITRLAALLKQQFETDVRSVLCRDVDQRVSLTVQDRPVCAAREERLQQVRLFRHQWYIERRLERQHINSFTLSCLKIRYRWKICKLDITN